MFSFLLDTYLAEELPGYTTPRYQRGCTILYFNQQCYEVFNFSIFSSIPVITIFIIAILVSVRCCITVVLICISLMINNVEHLFMCFLAICISSLGKCLLKFFVHFLIGLLPFYYWVVRVVYIEYIPDLSPSWVILASTVSHCLGCLFILMVVSFVAQKSLIFMKTNLSSLCVCVCVCVCHLCF